MKTKKKSILLQFIIFLSIAMIIYGINFIINKEKNSDEEKTSTFTYHEENLDLLTTTINFNKPNDILCALENTGVLLKDTSLKEQDIINYSDDTYGIYIGFMVYVTCSSESFEIIVYETEFGVDNILLYSSVNPDDMIHLSESDRNSLRYKQRRFVVYNTIQITPYYGVLLHNYLGVTFINNLKFTNCSDTAIIYVNIITTPILAGIEYDYNNKSYIMKDEIKVRQSIEQSLRVKDWTNYDFYKITQVTILFDDGTSIKLDKYDCQFLSDLDSD